MQPAGLLDCSPSTMPQLRRALPLVAEERHQERQLRVVFHSGDGIRRGLEGVHCGVRLGSHLSAPPLERQGNSAALTAVTRTTLSPPANPELDHLAGVGVRPLRLVRWVALGQMTPRWSEGTGRFPQWGQNAGGFGGRCSKALKITTRWRRVSSHVMRPLSTNRNITISVASTHEYRTGLSPP